jgi:RNA polymerase sigma-70 factor, ECF subfamily
MEVSHDDPGDRPALVPELTAAIARGDEAAFRCFHDLYWKRAYAYLMALTKGDEALAADLAQTTMIRAARRLRPMKSEAAVWGWVRTVAHHAFIDECRARRRAPMFVAPTEIESDATADCPSEGVPLLEALDAALQRLSVEERALVEAAYLQRKRRADLAVLLGVSIKAVESRLTRLRQKLRRAIVNRVRNEEI